MSRPERPERGPICLVVLDGFGCGEGGEGDATALADAPFLERCNAIYPRAELETSGRMVGLPDGQMGNSEVGHMTLGAGRVIEQDVVRIQRAVDAGALDRNPTFEALLETARGAGGALHLMGLISDGGVHSSLEHLRAILDRLAEVGVRPVLHAFTDGRDTPPQSALRWIEPLEARLRELGGCIATVSGRYWAMDRDKRWERVARAVRAIVLRQGHEVASGAEAVEKGYAREQGDEFIEPSCVGDAPALSDGDAVLFFNFRADRGREISNALTRVRPDLLGSEVAGLRRLALGAFATWTEYDASYNLPVVFESPSVPRSFGELVEAAGLRQLRIAETEKYAHVTYFFSGGRETPFRGENRILIPSPQDVPTYDKKPEMSALGVTDALLEALDETAYDFVLVNYANPDMVGHTGVLEAGVRAVEVVDACLDRLSSCVLARGGQLLITADHGNIERMIDPESGGAHTAHTTNPVPLWWVSREVEAGALASGGLADVAPTLCELLGLEAPAEMTGRSLLSRERAS